MEDIIGYVIIYTFATAGVVLPLFVIVQSIVNFARASDGLGTIILKALLVLGAWAFLTFTFVMIAFMYVFEVSGMRDNAAASRRMTILTAVLTLIYVAVGVALGYWVRLQPGWRTLRQSRDRI
jgi:formate hydrogenlyase subunit 3/multisubunit Na+/H+ antiporter MnhD subunit